MHKLEDVLIMMNNHIRSIEDEAQDDVEVEVRNVDDE